MVEEHFLQEKVGVEEEEDCSNQVGQVEVAEALEL